MNNSAGKRSKNVQDSQDAYRRLCQRAGRLAVQEQSDAGRILERRTIFRSRLKGYLETHCRVDERLDCALLNEVLADLLAAGLEVQIPDAVSINTRFRKKMGRCILEGLPQKKQYRIELSAQLLNAGRSRMLRDVFAHELIHTRKDCMNHQDPFRQALKAAARFLPDYTITVRFDPALYQKERWDPLAQKMMPPIVMEDTAAKEQHTKYWIECTSCAQLYRRKRMCPVVEHPEWYRCSRCGGKLRLVEPV